MFGGASLFHYSFLESQWNHYMWEVCSANRWDEMKTAMPAVSIGQQNGPNSSPGQRPTACHTTNASKVEWNSLQSFASSAVFTWPLANYHFFKHLNNLLQGKCSHNQKEAKNGYSKSLSNPKAQIFMLQEQTNLFLVGKNVLIVIDPIFDYKTVFEPSYNDLKFLVWNCNYFFTNLIEGRNPRSIIGSESESFQETLPLSLQRSGHTALCIHRGDILELGKDLNSSLTLRLLKKKSWVGFLKRMKKIPLERAFLRSALPPGARSPCISP